MKKVLILILCLFSFSFVYAKNNSIPVYMEPSQTIYVDSSQPKFILKLKTNPSTGFNWYITTYDERFLTVQGHEYKAEKPIKPGSGGYTYWWFQVNKQAFKGPHLFAVNLIYAQAWNLESKDVYTFNIATHAYQDPDKYTR